MVISGCTPHGHLSCRHLKAFPRKLPSKSISNNSSLKRGNRKRKVGVSHENGREISKVEERDQGRKERRERDLLGNDIDQIILLCCVPI